MYSTCSCSTRYCLQVAEHEARVTELQRDVMDRCVQQEKQQQVLRRLKQEADDKSVVMKDVEMV